jgi:hypothetical protein
MSKAQRMYDNQAPDYNELPAGNGDWVVWEENNCSEIYDRACEYWNDQYEAAAQEYADYKMERMRGCD